MKYLLILALALIPIRAQALQFYDIQVWTNENNVIIAWKTDYKVPCSFILMGRAVVTKRHYMHKVEISDLEYNSIYMFMIRTKCEDSGTLIYKNYFSTPREKEKKRKREKI